MRRSARIAIAAGVLLAVACAGGSQPPLATVERVDLERYAGTWYETASFPTRFQRGCTDTTATYGLRADGRVSVRNRCRKDGEESAIEGVAWAVDESNARLKVRFFWPFSGDYQVIALDPDYGWAMVGHPARSYLWILSRSPRLDEAIYRDLLEQAEAQGFDTSRLARTLQPQPQDP